MKFVLFAVIVATAVNSAFGKQFDSKKEEIVSYRQRLKQLSSGSSPFKRVEYLIIKLAKIDPRHSVLYFRLGIKKIIRKSNTELNLILVRNRLVRIVQESDLPFAVKRQVVTDLEHIFEPIID